MEWTECFLEVRAPGVTFYVLRDPSGLWLIDTGFVFGRRSLQKALAKHGWDRLPIRGILLTHGHLDHILNVERLAADHGALIIAPQLDADYYTGQASYVGLSRITGWMEAMGRFLLGFRPFTPDQWLRDGDVLGVWGGLRAIHLLGHTDGHMGFYSEIHRVLFVGDLFASYGKRGSLPPVIFNKDRDEISRSIHKALLLPLRGVLPNHGDGSLPGVHLERLQRLGASLETN
jgi:glyoxylase-like metal-dependent hydrolase (beta-lactamase superfamily II)